MEPDATVVFTGGDGQVRMAFFASDLLEEVPGMYCLTVLDNAVRSPGLSPLSTLQIWQCSTLCVLYSPGQGTLGCSLHKLPPS